MNYPEPFDLVRIQWEGGSVVGVLASLQVYPDEQALDLDILEPTEMPALVLPVAWQPIETAPKDGTPVLVADGSWVGVLAWDRYANGWVNDEMDSASPTHWRPLPKPPAS